MPRKDNPIYHLAAAVGVRLIAEDVRGIYGRKVVFNVVNGSVRVQKGNGEVKRI